MEKVGEHPQNAHGRACGTPGEEKPCKNHSIGSMMFSRCLYWDSCGNDPSVVTTRSRRMHHQFICWYRTRNTLGSFSTTFLIMGCLIKLRCRKSIRLEKMPAQKTKPSPTDFSFHYQMNYQMNYIFPRTSKTTKLVLLMNSFFFCIDYSRTSGLHYMNVICNTCHMKNQHSS